MSPRSRSRSADAAAGLRCPSCGAAHPPGDRFCPACAMPLVVESAAGLEPARSEAHERARKVAPEYVGGDPVRVARARNQAEAELVQGLLLEEGVPSMLRRSAGFDVPDMLAAGERDVLVPAAGFQAAHDVLMTSGLQDLAAVPPPVPDVRQALRLAAAIAAGAGLTAFVAWVLLSLTG